MSFMSRDELLNIITTEDVIGIMAKLGTDYKTNKSHSDQLYFRTVCHHGNKYKLLYYTDSKLFHCLTEDGIISLFDVVMGALECEFIDAVKFIEQYKGIKTFSTKRKVGIQGRKSEAEKDMEFLDKHLYKPLSTKIKLPNYNNDILKIFDDYYPSCWEDEGLSVEEMEYFGVKMYFNQMKAILPHRDINGNLIGIRGRSFMESDIDNGKKYMPITIQGLTYRFPTGLTLYGAYENKDNIKRLKKCILFEGEKSPIKYGSYYGQNNNIGLATLGTNLSSYQRNLILDMGVSEVIMAYDKQFQPDLIDKEDDKAIKEYNAYIKKMIKAYKMFSPYCLFSITYCEDDRLDYKDAPIDKGKEVFSELYKERITIENIEELEESLL